MSDERSTGVRSLSVVIATLGGGALASTLAWLNAGDNPPSEILVCIPEAEAHRAESLCRGNVRLVVTAVRGQVAQRAEGFRQAREQYVLQLDDDMLIRQRDVGSLIEALERLGSGNAVAPVYLEKATRLGVHRQYDGLRGFLQSLNATILGAAAWGPRRMGTVTDIGTNFGIDAARTSDAFIAVDWMPGGCVLHWREALVLDAFFPYPGKAYCEDLIHSHLLATRGIRLWVVRDVSVLSDSFILPTDWRGLRAEARARLYFVRLRGSVPLRFWVWLGVSVVKRTLASVMRRPDAVPRQAR